MSSSPLEAVVRLASMQRCIDDLLLSIDHVLLRLVRALADDHSLVLLRARDHAQLHLHLVSHSLASSNHALHALHHSLHTRSHSLLHRKHTLRRAQLALHSKQQSLSQIRTRVAHYQQLSLSLARDLQLQRSLLLSHLALLFPIDSVDPSSLLFSILGLPLPNSDFSAAALPDDDHLSAALGYTAHLVNLLAIYLAVPIYYPLSLIGSRSLIQDPISTIRGTRLFPLYSKGVDRYRFDYALYLLNKNVEQIMDAYDISLPDIRQLLPNLKNIIITVSARGSSITHQPLPFSSSNSSLSSSSSSSSFSSSPSSSFSPSSSSSPLPSYQEKQPHPNSSLTSSHQDDHLTAIKTNTNSTSTSNRRSASLKSFKSDKTITLPRNNHRNSNNNNINHHGSTTTSSSPHRNSINSRSSSLSSPSSSSSSPSSSPSSLSSPPPHPSLSTPDFISNIPSPSPTTTTTTTTTT